MRTLGCCSTLRSKWGFDGYVITDQFAVESLYWYWKYATSFADASARVLNSGVDLIMGFGQEYWLLGIQSMLGKLSSAQLDIAVSRVFRSRFLLGLFDPPELVPYSHPADTVDAPEHRALARRAAESSIVLLKNDGLLPLGEPKTIALIGKHAHEAHALLGNYGGTPSHVVTPLESLAQRLPQARILTADDPATAARVAAQADVAILCLGLTAREENESEATLVEHFLKRQPVSKDRDQIELPAEALALWKAVRAIGRPTVVVLFGGGALAFDPGDANAILELVSRRRGRPCGCQNPFGRY